MKRMVATAEESSDVPRLSRGVENVAAAAEKLEVKISIFVFKFLT